MSEASCPEEAVYDLLNQFERILEFDPLIDEVGFIHPSHFSTLNEEVGSSHASFGSCEPQLEHGILRADNNTHFWNRDHKLGISTQILFPLYNVTKHAFMAALRQYKMLGNVPDESLEKSITCAMSCSFDTLETEVMKHSKALLLLSSDFGTAWNARRLVVSKKQHLPIFLDELLLSALILSYSPKSEQAWGHRRWVIKVVAGKYPTLQEIIGKESELAQKMAERSKMNYRAWNHRCWLVSNMKREQVLNELSKSRNWAGLHIADNSCFHYRRRLMLKLLETCCNEQGSECSSYTSETYQVWKEELDWNEALIRYYVGREALWLHRRFLSLSWMRHFATDPHSFSSHSEQKTSIDNHISIFIDNEIGLVNSCSIIPDDGFEDFQAQALHATSYILWLTKQTPESWLLVEEKLGAGDLKTLLNKACPDRSSLWDHVLPLIQPA